MSADPKTCSFPGCKGWAMYKLGSRGFCEQHKPICVRVFHTPSGGQHRGYRIKESRDGQR